MTADIILQTTGRHFGITVAQMKGVNRHADVVHARSVAMLLVRKHLKLSLPKIGHIFGGKDHSGVRTAIARAAKHPDTASAVCMIERALGTPGRMPSAGDVVIYSNGRGGTRPALVLNIVESEIELRVFGDLICDDIHIWAVPGSHETTGWFWPENKGA